MPVPHITVPPPPHKPPERGLISSLQPGTVFRIFPGSEELYLRLEGLQYVRIQGPSACCVWLVHSPSENSIGTQYCEVVATISFDL